jgi:hypothetical protein
LDAARAATACGSAEEEAFRSNCIEGVFSFIREFTLRKSSAEWRDVRVDLDYCEETFHLDARFYAACYRSVALDQRQLIGKDAKLEDLTTGFYPELQAACAESAQETRRLACWESVGQFVAPFILADDDPKGAAKTWIPVCRKAVGESKTQCYQRLVFELVKTGQRPSGLAKEYLLELLPEEVHEIVEPRLESWLDSLVGRGV